MMKTKETILRYMTKQFRTLFVLALVLFSVLTVQAQAPVKTQPRIGGAVFGGGRMADVGTNTVVTIVNCDTISAVYGGNDIAGTVAGANGSTIAVGTLTGNARGVTNGEINIGSVYGGGNGYYKYDNNAPGVAVGTTVLTGRTFSTSVTDVAGGDSYVSSGTIPSIGKTSITVNTDFVRIDSLFGGAKNAFITGTEGNNTYIDINGGVIYAVFGGNNFGGTLAAAKQVINVDGTKTNTSSSVNLGGTYANGRAWTSDDSEHGIRYLFGGGNKVSGKTVEIYVNGGQIDTLFGGGNSADVTSTTVNVNVTSPLYTLATSPYTDPATYAYSTTTSVFDIRCLFGGNNAADMSGLPTLNLTKGGVHNVYGGGNKGVMLAANPYTDNYARESITPTSNTNHKEGAKRSTNVLVNSADFIADTIYGGGQSAGTLHDTYVEIAAGNVGVVYGGTNIMGQIGPTQAGARRDLAKTNVYIHGGTVYNSVFGASNGLYRCHNGNIYLAGDNPFFADANAYSYLIDQNTPSVFNSYVYITTGANIYGNVYGGGNMAVVGKPAAIASPAVLDMAGISLLHIDGGTIGHADGGDTIWGNVYGGGNMGSVYGAADVIVSGSPIIYGNVYGGNDKTGRVYSPLRGLALTEIHNSSSLAQASALRSEYPGLPVDITQNQPLALNEQNAATYTLIKDTPKIYGSVFGGGNGDYEYVNTYSDKAVAITAGTSADRVVIDCSGTASADERSSFVDINVGENGYVNRVFGGGNSRTTGYALNNGTPEEGFSYVFLNSTAAPANDENHVNVGTIFGGNNNVEMNKVPRIVMLQGKVGNVYGGGNMGAMTGLAVVSSLPVSTYVATPSPNVVVTENIYGGCNVADVENDTYVKVTQGKIRGNVFGGNDLSGTVGISHVIIDGKASGNLAISGNVYGGGNGDYALYTQQVDANGAYYTKTDASTVHAYTDAAAAEGASAGVAGKYCTSHFTFFDLDGRPYVDSASVVLNGEFTMTGNVYGGGISGDCRKTNVLVDAENGTFNGMIFGAGRGRVDNMGLRIDGTCKGLYIGVAQDANGDGVTDRDGSGNIIFGEGNAMGNVLDTAWLTVRRFKAMGGRSAMFGGGQSGNVGTTVVNYESTAVNPIKALYLGCLASNVTNAATGIINATETPSHGEAIIDTIYGGNDFTGRVERTELTINSGVFTHVFGAGNGDYDYDQWIVNRTELADDASTLALGHCADTVPYTMDVVVNINGGNFLNTVYGGGNMGLVGDRDMAAANMTSANADRADYIGTITMNVHGGEFHRHLFTGARGKANMEGSRFFNYTANGVDGQELGKQLAYAQKILNMDGGHVMFSVYGGSEAVDDGFPYECIGAVNYAANPLVNTTLRPSTIMNITGGRIEKSVYGGGYQGNIYGSVYVNVGIDAVRDCPAWTKTFGNFNVAAYKPNLLDHSGYTVHNTLSGKTVEPVTTSNIPGNVTLKKGVVNLEASVYNASDWGEAGANAYFLTRGVFGGVTNILIDGKGYYTSLTNPFDVDLPEMTIAYSVIGAGTSTEGGDVNRLITIRHYGDYACPEPSRTLFSIQRADKVVLDSVFITLHGEQDAFSAYASPSYSFCRIDTLIYRVDNIVMIESPAIYVGNLVSLKTDEVYDIFNTAYQYDNAEVENPTDNTDPSNPVVSTTPNDFLDNLYGRPGAGQTCNDVSCDNLGVCERLPSERGQDGHAAARNVLMMRNGSYVRVSPFVDNIDNSTSTAGHDGLDDPDHAFGHVLGWMYLLAQDQTMSYVYADVKRAAEGVNPAANLNDGGFVSTCYCENKNGTYTDELDYTNVTIPGESHYRSWKIGTNQGSRVRHITLVANANPDGTLNFNLPGGNYDLYVKDVDGGNDVTVNAADGYAYATTTLELPPADGGSFYVINSVLIDQDNGGQLKLVDQAYEKKDNIFFQPADDADNLLPSIAAEPDYTFGLTFASNENFENGCWNTEAPIPGFNSISTETFNRNLTSDGTSSGDRYSCWSHSVISGNQYITNQGGYISNAIVSGAVGAIPTMQFTLTYNKNISTTITRDVIFTMYEFDKNGHFVGPVEVTVTISTVIKEFSDLEAPVLAMFNEGITDEYVRKITIPASFQQRDIYITGVEWLKDTIDTYTYIPQGGGESQNVTVYSDPNKVNWFNLEAYDGTAPENNNHFSVILKPTESASENINNTLGWYHINKREGIDVYQMAKTDYEETESTSGNFEDIENVSKVYHSQNYHTQMAEEGRGIWVGTLDGRSTASIDVSLKFNGLYYYHPQFTPPLAWVRLKCKYYNTKTVTPADNEFYIYVKIRTRLQGDTIYMAPGKTLTRTIASSADPNVTRNLMMHAYGYGYVEGTSPDDFEPDANAVPNYTNIEAQKADIKNNPNNYLQSFNQVMRIYEEGDVIDIMETIPIDNGELPTTVMGDDHSIIQIIRYSGSHYKFPSMACANYNPLLEIKGNGHLTMRNVWFNGSGCTRTKPINSSGGACDGAYTNVGTDVYCDKYARVEATLFANAPIVYCHQHGEANFTKNVIFSNNFNRTNTATDPDSICGGAIALVDDNAEGEPPMITIGDMGHVYDNLVIDWDAAGGANDMLPHNYGGGVYVDNGQLLLGGGDAAGININRNFYLKTDNPQVSIKTKVAHMFGENETDIPISFDVYYLDTLNSAQYYSLSNVYLTRKPYMCDNTDDGVNNPVSLARRDAQSDVVYFLSTLTPESRIGISKWFPGYRYENSRTTGVHFLNEETPRDTVSIARIGRGKANTALVDNNYNAHVFFNDSSYYSISSRVGTEPSFTNSYPAVTYTGNTTAYPDYNDKVFIFRHTSLSPYNIYFQRCGSFGKGVKQELETDACFANAQGMQFNKYVYGDSISYHWNSNATCALAMDTLQFRVGGGFFPYTYKWYDVSDTVAGVVDRKDLHSRTTTGSNAIARYGTANDEYAQLRRKAESDTLVFRLEVMTSNNRHNYAFEVTATDLTGNCPVTQDVKVRAVKIADDHHHHGAFIYDYANFLQHRKRGALSGADTAAQRAQELFYRIKSPGVDSSSFHDRADNVPDHHLVTSEDDQGGLRRAGWTHLADCNTYDQSANGGEGNGNADFSGKPYKGDGTCADGDMTPRYLRIFQSFRVKPSIYPVAARGSIRITDINDNELDDLTSAEMSNDRYHSEFEVCPGEVLHLTPTVGSNWEFIGWDYDPSSPESANFVVGTSSEVNNPIIFYVPGDYWWQHVTSFDNRDVEGDEHTATLRDYDLDYYGNVTIKTEKGLAWLISTVNGYNSQNAQTFHFNTITLDPTDGTPFDMSAHKWTPLGNANNPFEGVFDGNGKHVTNILVNETTLPLVGMFGQTRGATIKNFIVDSTMVRGNTYVSAIVGEATENTLVKDVTIQRGAIFGEYTIGGFISHMVNSSLIGCRLWSTGEGGAGRIGAYGNAIYAGGFLGLLEGVDTVRNNSAQNYGYINISKLSALYVGAIIGYSKGAVVMGKNKSNNRTIFNNNYARLVTSSTSQRVGGLIGYAKDIEMNNNYVYGIANYDKNNGFVGGIAGFIDDNVSISNCYYVDGMAENMVGFNLGTAPQKSTTFKGKGNNVLLTETVDGYSNLTRALNAWVRDNDSTGIYYTWRSDLENANSGYPVFGEPDLIPVNDTLITSSCENFEFDGLTFDQSGTYIFHIVDSNDFVDSTLTLMLTINYGDTTQVSDTVNLGEGYEGHGFSLTADQLRTLSQDSRVRDVYTLHFIDSLQNANGCDSLVVLTLYVVNSGVDVTEVQKLVDVKVYPNPTRGIVNVEGSDLQSIEVYDNVSRRVLSKKVEGDKTIFDLNDQAAGAYYVRIRTANGTVVKKVIKK